MPFGNEVYFSSYRAEAPSSNQTASFKQRPHANDSYPAQQPPDAADKIRGEPQQVRL